MSKTEGETNFSRHLPYRLSGTGIVERKSQRTIDFPVEHFRCSEIIDVECNLKQVDGLTGLTLTTRFYDRPTPLVMWAHVRASEARGGICMGSYIPNIYVGDIDMYIPVPPPPPRKT